MKRLDIVLVAVLILQVLLCLNLRQAQTRQTAFSRPDLSCPQPDTLVLTRGGKTQTFARLTGGPFHNKRVWTLPELERFPAREHTVEQFINRVLTYEAGPVKGDTPEMAHELRVADDHFYSRLTLANKDGEDLTLFVAPGPHNSDYVRLKDDTKVYQLSPSIRHWLHTEQDKWIDSHLYSFNTPIEKFSWRRGGLEFTVAFDGLVWRLNTKNGTHTLDTDKVNAFLDTLKQMPVDTPLGIRDPYALKPPPIFLFLQSGSEDVKLNITPKVMIESGQTGFRVSRDLDTREIFVSRETFMGLFDPDGGAYLFLPEKK